MTLAVTIFLSTDIDECAEGSFSCRAQQTCANTDGSYTCVGISGRDPNVGPSCEAGYVYNQISLRCEGLSISCISYQIHTGISKCVYMYQIPTFT